MGARFKDNLKPCAAIAATLAALCLLLNSSLARDGSQGDQPRGVGVKPGAAVAQWPVAEKRFALIIGIDQYKKRQIAPLQGAANDARTLAEALVRYAGFPRKQVILLASDQPEAQQPMRNIILAYLANLRGLIPPDGLLLLAFAGHGFERDGRAFLLPADAILANDDMMLLEDTAISVARMKEAIRATQVAQVILLLDACRNDPQSSRANDNNRLTEAYTQGFRFDVRNREVTAFATLYATAVGHRAYEYAQHNQGYFTWAIVEGLRGGAANAHGEVTLGGLIRFVQESVPWLVRRDLGKDCEQKPFAEVEGYKADNLVIAMATPGNLPTPNEPQTVEPPHSREAEPTVVVKPTKIPNAKLGRVLIQIAEPNSAEPLISRALAAQLAARGLSATLDVELSAAEGLRLRHVIEKLEASDRNAAKALPFALVVTGNVTVAALEPYQGLQIAVARGTIKAIDVARGQTTARENITDVRGFGNTPEQAARNALKNAGERISERFINQIVSNSQ